MGRPNANCKTLHGDLSKSHRRIEQLLSFLGMDGFSKAINYKANYYAEAASSSEASFDCAVVEVAIASTSGL